MPPTGLARQRHDIKSLPGYLRGRPELEQAVLRMVFGMMAIVAYALPDAGAGASSAGRLCTQIMIALYVLFGVASYVAVRRKPSQSRTRLWITTFLDQCLLAVALVVGEEAALPLAFVIFWFLVGAGCRYGIGPLSVSATTAALGLCLLTTISPWWTDNRPAVIGLMIAVVATALYLYVLVGRIEHRARTDGMTGLLNRSSLDAELHRAFARVQSHQKQAALFLMDLDGFKEVNDTFGHAVGDDLLRRFSEGLRHQASRHDLVARIGGDEFVVFTWRDSARFGAAHRARLTHRLLERIRQACDQPIAVSASIGIVLIHPSAKAPLSVRATMKRADRAMYLAKQRGKNGTAFAEELPDL